MSDSSPVGINKEEIKELMVYLKNIDQYQFTLKSRYVIFGNMIWGILLTITGVLDYFMFQAWQNVGPAWLMMYITGALLVNRLKKEIQFINLTFTPTMEKKGLGLREEINLILGFVFISIVMSIEIYYGFLYLAFPTVGLFVGTLLFRSARREYQWAWNRLDYLESNHPDQNFSSTRKLVKNLTFLPFLTCYASIFVNLGAYFFISNGFVVYQGLVFGLMIGLGITFQMLILDNLLYSDKYWTGEM